MPGSAVSCASLTLINPRSSSTLVLSRPTSCSARGAAHGDENLFGFLLDGLAVCADPRHLHASFGLFNLFDLCAGVDVDAALLEDAREFLRNFFVFGRDHARQELDNRDLGAEAAEDGTELYAYGAGANHDERFGHLGHREHFDVGKDAIVRREAEHHLRVGAGGDNDILRLELGGRTVGRTGKRNGVHAVFCAAGEPSVAGDHRDLVLLHQEFEALGVLVDDAGFALLHGFPVERTAVDALDAVFGMRA